MTGVNRRSRAVLSTEESGSVLAIALVFLMLFGLVIGVTLQFAATSQRTGLSVSDEGASTYAGGGALDGAINRLRAAGNTAIGTTASGTTTCFTLPAGQLDNAADVAVTCTPRSNSGTTSTNVSANTPVNAVLATSTNNAEGVSLSGAANVPVRGNVEVNRRVLVPAGSTLSSTGTIQATTCTGTTSPTCTSPNTAVDPGWANPTSYPAVVDLGTVTCQAPLMRLSPGTYLSLAKLQAVLACPNTIVWFQPGLYYLDFRDTAGAAASHELVSDVGDVIVGGTALGWDPNAAGLTPGSLPDPSKGSPGLSACDPDAAGVNFVFGNDSRLHVRGGKVQLCALSTASTAQHVVMQGLSADTGGLNGAATATPTLASSTSWATPNGALTLGDGQVATATVARGGAGKSIQLGPIAAFAVPPDATNVLATVEVTESVTSTTGNRRGIVALTANAGDGSGNATLTLRDCRAIACTGASRVDTASFPALTPSQANGASLTLTLDDDGSNGNVSAAVDGLVVEFSFTAPLNSTSGSTASAPYVRGSLTATPVLRTSGTDPEAVLALHGTVDTPLAAVDLGLTDVAHTVADRGVLVRHLETSMTRAPGFTGPLIEVPGIGARPRQVYLRAVSNGVELARADVTFRDAAGTGNGTFADLNEWFVN